MSFSDLGLCPPLLRALEGAKYETPTPIQAAAIPAALAGKDVLGCARTGTGKTAAFSLPILQHCDTRAGDNPVIRALILTPTRELAAQIGDSLATYGRDLDLYHTTIFGGVSEKPQIAELRRGVDILVATPGRLLDLQQRGLVDLRNVEIFVLDEADRMLDMGFIHDVRAVTKTLPKKRQTLFFSATMPPSIRELANSLLTDPVQVSVTPVSSTVEEVQQFLYYTDKNSKRRLLSHLLNDEAYERVVVFARTKHGSDRVARHLAQDGLSVAAIHGDKAQNARTRALDGFRKGEIRVLVATDIAARGIDVDGVTHVINFDVPNVAETYVHRIGRTARAGKSGIAVSLCDHEERAYVGDIEKLTKKRLVLISDHPFPAGSAPPEAPKQVNHRGGGGRPVQGAQSRRPNRGRGPRRSTSSSASA
jgi:ATP-dependent RNA helicase RhlE